MCGVLATSGGKTKMALVDNQVSYDKHEIGLKAERVGLPPLNHTRFYAEDPQLEKDMCTFFLQEMVKRGIIWGNYISYSHRQEDIDKTLHAVQETLSIVKEAIEKGDVSLRLEGDERKTAFRRMV